MLQKIGYIPHGYRNSWTPIFEGTLTACDDGTMIKGFFSVHDFVKAFMIIWRGFMILIFLGIFLGAFLNNNISMVIFASTPLLMLMFSYVIEKIGVQMGEDGKENILSFIENELCGSSQ